jgi:demethylmenaquinone methyltransferase/2-methoxy-6-polyprenyl-1,4-benzoquinol methylase
MDLAKAKFFDTQVNSTWASNEYTAAERVRIDQVMSAVDLHKGMSVLEPGCGVGRLTEIMAQKVGQQGKVLALDMSRSMAGSCASRMASYGNVGVTHAALEDRQLSLCGFDLVVCHNVFPHFADKERALRKMSSALSKNGRIVIFHFLSSSKINDIRRKISRAVLKDLMPTFSEMQSLFRAVDMKIDIYSDDLQGFLLSGSRSTGATPIR